MSNMLIVKCQISGIKW